ncbi:MAG: hypothetical protein IJT77_11435, partial [Clostridia bacterium]|nr:hypothetical protein [Clostridia bacterium]
ICCEEMVYEMLNHCYGSVGATDMKLDISYAEADHTVQIGLSCGGAAYNPFVQEEDGLGVTILKNMAKRLDYHLEVGRNVINITL